MTRYCKFCTVEHPDTKEFWRIRGKYYQCKKQLVAKHTEWRNRNLDSAREYARNYYKANAKTIIAKNYNFTKRKRKKDSGYNLAILLRQRLNVALRKQYKAGSAVRDLGCSVAELKLYLEGKFEAGMSWDNQGRGGWHLDHIRPLSSFDLTDPEQLKQAVHFTNLQPMWEVDNIRKSNKWSAEVSA